MRAEQHQEMPDNPFGGGGEIETLLRHDWSQTPLGAVETWSDSLKTAVQSRLTELNQAQRPEPVQQASILSQNCTQTATLRQAAQADGFRVTLFDALRLLTDANEIQATAARILGEHLGASRVIYAEVLPGGKDVIVHKNYTNGVAELSGQYRLDEFGRNLTDDHQAGQLAIVADVASSLNYTDQEKAVYRAIDIAAHLDVPLIKNDQFVALLAVHQATPREWTEREVTWVEETAEQTWAAVERARAEAALRESEAKYRTLFESIDEGFCICEMLFDGQGEPNDYRFLEVNSAFEQLTGLEQATGKRMRELAPNHDAYWFEIYGRVVQTREPIRFENYASALNRWFNVNAFCIGEPQNNQFAILFTNITEAKRVEDERKQAETAFLQSEAQSQNILKSITDGFFALDQDWRFTYVNPQAERILDRTPGDLLGKVIWEVYPGTVGTEFEQAYRRTASERVAASFTSFYPDHNCWYEAHAYPATNGITVYFRNVTEQVQAEAALRESEELKQSILDSSKDCIKVLTLNSEIVYISTGGLCLLEVDDPTDILNTSWVDFWQGEDYESAKIAIAAAKAGGSGQFQGYLPTWKGTPKWWDSIITPVWNSAGQITQLVAISRDITRQKQIETEREQLLQQEQAAREEAQRANRIKDEFLAVLSHELRSPLNPILGWTQLLRNGKLDAARQINALDTIERNAKLQAQLIEDLLDISRIMQGKLPLTATSVSLAFVIAAAVETVRLAADAKNIQITLDLDPDVAPVSGDAARLQQMVWNLLTNAVKFTDNGGQVAVQLRQVATEGSFSNAMAQIRVIDTGKGISPQFLPHVFEYFRQEDGSTTRKFGGLGLGLAIVRQIVELHGGTVNAESGGDAQGATFSVQLPAPQQATPLLSEQNQLQSGAETRLDNVQILLVEDDADTREFQAFLLEQHGAAVTAVASGVEALQALEQFVPDVIVSDIGMAEMDGYGLMQQIRSRLPAQGGAVPAIALTAYAAEIDQEKAFQAGFQTHLTKPLEPKRFISEIVTLLKPNRV